jgi:U2-associated protein SR140
MFGGGSLWKPPSLKNLRGKVIPPIMEIVKRGQLSSEDRDIFEGMLREITMERSKIREGMVWCIDHAESAEEIADCLCESLTIDETLLPLKIARLYLLSDVLQNTSSKTASKYRRIFEGKLVPLIEHLHVILVGINSRLRAESFKRRVLKCFQAWDQLTVYHFNFVDKLRELFIGKTQEELEKKKAFETVAALISDQPSDDTGNDELIDNRPIDFSGGSDTVMFNPGGDIDGEPLPDLDVDGVPLGDPDIDGVPLDEDIDGIPMDTTPAVSKVVQSKWETVDSSDDSSDQEKNRPKRKRENETASLDEEDMKMRQTLREVELKVLELVEALESSGNYTADEIAAKSSKFRNKLYTEAMDAKKKDKKQVDDKRRQSEDSPSRKRRTSSSDQRDKSPPHKKRHKSPSSRRKSSPDHHHRHRRRSSSSSRSPPRHRSRSPSSTHR